MTGALRRRNPQRGRMLRQQQQRGKTMGKCRSVNLTNEMKTKLVTLLFVGLSAGCLVGLAQNPADEKVQKLYNQPAGAAKTAAPGEALTAVPAEPVGAILPLVQFEDAPLVDVIKTLARQASLNVIFDPRGTTLGEGGKSLYPPVSIRLESVTAQNVVEAVLNNNNLRLEKDPKT